MMEGTGSLSSTSKVTESSSSEGKEGEELILEVPKGDKP